MADDATNIYDLDVSLPVAGGDAGEGDDEIRVFKNAVKQSIAGNDGTTNWAAQPDWDREAADYYDATPLRLGPRGLNALPKSMDAITTAVNDLDDRVTALEDGLADAVAAAVPVGMIVMWSGTLVALAALSPVWVICDGTNGTPDLRDRFIVGAGSAYAVGATGGGAANTSAGGDHSHGGATQSHILTVAQMPAHGHPYQHKTGSEASTQSADDGGIVTGAAASVATEAAFSGAASSTGGEQIGGAGGGEGHTHGITASGTHTHPIDVRPAYYALAYVMFKGVA